MKLGLECFEDALKIRPGFIMHIAVLKCPFYCGFKRVISTHLWHLRHPEWRACASQGNLSPLIGVKGVMPNRYALAKGCTRCCNI